jgi:peptidoglycan/LPS O-acetylase OafA/YrhL
MTAALAEPAVVEDRGRPGLRHVPALDGLRGLAVGAVLLFHAGHLVGGYLGVDLFFVLSGFLITSLLLREASSSGRITLSSFWVRRARRLLPAMAGVLVGVAAYARFVADSSELDRIRGDGIATVAYVANWRAIFAEQDYWDLFAAPSPLQHMWSVAIEEQFYLLWPLVIVGLLRWRGPERLPRTVLATSLVLAAISVASMVLLYDTSDNTRVYFGTDTRAASILVGAALAAWTVVRGTGRRVLAGTAGQVVGLGAAAILGYAWTQVEGTSAWLYQGGMLALAVVAVVVIAVASAPEPGLLARGLSVAPLRWLGLVSYGTYLWHWPIYLVLSPERTGIEGWPLVVLRITVTLAVAAVSYVVIEQPIRRGTLRRIDLRVLSPVVAATVVVALVLGTSGATSTTPLGAEVEEVLPDALPAAVAVLEEAPPEAESVMVTGNSIGLYLGRGMQGIAADESIVAVNRSTLGCTFPLPEDIRLGNGERFPQGLVDCTTDWAEDLRALRPDTVVVAFNDPGDADYLLEGRWTHPCMPDYDGWLGREWHRAIDLLSGTGADVVIVTPGYSEIAYAPEARLSRTDCANEVVREVAEEHPDAVVADVARYVCPDLPCRQEIDGIVLRPDGLHYVGASAEHIAGWVLREGRRLRADER